MKNYSWLLFIGAILLAPILNANYEFLFTEKEKISEAQWDRYFEGAKVAYHKSMGPQIVAEMFPKMRAAGRDVLEMKKEGEYFGHVFINESQLVHETLYRVGFFGLNHEEDFKEFSEQMMPALKEKYKGFDLACGSPSMANQLIDQIKSLGFIEDSSVAEDPAIMMQLYGLDTTKGRYSWFRFENK